MVLLVEDHVHSRASETKNAEVVGKSKGPCDAEIVWFSLDDPHIDGRGDDEESHVRGEEVGLEESVEEIEDLEPIGRFDSIVDHF